MSYNGEATDFEIIDLVPMQGGAWKVAYADFVTAMMAFFLLMWLLSATTEEQRSGIADYFDPKVPISQTSAGGMGMFSGDNVFAQKRLARNGLGGAGKKAASGRDDKEKHEVSSNEDVWSKGTQTSELVGNSKGENDNSSEKNQSAEAKEKQKAEEIETEIRRQIENISPGEGLSEQLNFKMTDEGLRIDITDNNGVPMFQSGSDNPTNKMEQILAVVGSVVSQLENEISITGHTDSTPFKSRRNYSNWELSSDRAHAARRQLLGYGVDSSRFKRIEGRSDREPILADNTESPLNRRIGIVLLRDNSIEAMRKAHMENSASFEQDKILQDDSREIGSAGASQKDIFIPDASQF